MIFHFSDSAFLISKFFHKMTYFVTSRHLEMQHFLKVSFSVPVTFFNTANTQGLYCYFFLNVILGWCGLGSILTEHIVFVSYCYMADSQNISVVYNNEVTWQSQHLRDGKVCSSLRDHEWWLYYGVVVVRGLLFVQQ